MKIFCWVKQIIKRFIYEKTIRPFNTSDYYGSAIAKLLGMVLEGA